MPAVGAEGRDAKPRSLLPGPAPTKGSCVLCPPRAPSDPADRSGTAPRDVRASQGASSPSACAGKAGEPRASPGSPIAAMEHPDIPKNLSLPTWSCLCLKGCQGECALTVLPPHLLLQSPAQRGWEKRTGTWLLPRCLCPGDSPRGTPRVLPSWGPRAGWLPAKHPCGPKDRSSRAASLTRGKCVTTSRPGQSSSNRAAPLAHPACREPGVRQLYPGGSHAAGEGVGCTLGWDRNKPVPRGGGLSRHPRLPQPPKGRLRLSPATQWQGVRVREPSSALR